MEENEVCPKCHDGVLKKKGDRLVCTHCGEEFELEAVEAK